MAAQKKILLYTPTFPPTTNGIATRIRQTLRELRLQGDEVVVVTPRVRGLPREFEGFLVMGVLSVPLVGYPGFQYGLPWYSQEMYDCLLAFQPDVVHAIDPLPGMGWLASAMAQRLCVPLVTSYHTNLPLYLHYYRMGFLEPVLWGYIYWMHSQAALTLCPSLSTQQLLQQHGLLPVGLWQSGVDSAQFHPNRRSSDWRSRLTDQHPERCVLLYVGRLAAEKNIQQLFPVLAALNEDHQGPLCHLAIVGDGPQKGRLQRLAHHLPVTFCGRLLGRELAAATASADIFCVASVSETFGNSTLEAMASGLAIVAAGADGTNDLLTEQQTGLLFDHPDQLFQALRRLRDEPALRSRLGRAARSAAEGWTWTAGTQQLLHAYEQAIQAARYKREVA